MPTRRPRALFLTACTLAGGGCAGSPPPIANGPVYPDRAQSGVIDVQVVRHTTSITMTNTSARAFKDARLWANQWYSRELPAWNPGQTLTLGLEEFTDRYGQPMKAGGFWAVNNPERLVLMQVEQGSELTGLIVIGQAE